MRRGEREREIERGGERDKEILDTAEWSFSSTLWSSTPYLLFSNRGCRIRNKKTLNAVCTPMEDNCLVPTLSFTFGLFFSFDLFVFYISPSLLSLLYFYIICEIWEMRLFFCSDMHCILFSFTWGFETAMRMIACLFVTRKSENDKKKLWH